MDRGMISVDRWTEGSQFYFLTHLHADHTKGLTTNWAKGPVFCSPLTAMLFPFKFPGFNLSLLRVIDVGTWHYFPVISPPTGSQTVVKVMAIDAHHCPGAVMFLFLGDFGCLLYTGDFRWESTSERAKIGRSMLFNALRDYKLDTLYLDNTYCNPSYSFPSREDAAQQVVVIIESHPEHDIIIGIDSLGKEDLLLYIAHMLQIKIWVWPERLQSMHLLGFHDVFTTNTSLTRVRAVPRYSFSIETLEGLNTMRPTIGIMPSGLPWLVQPLKGDIDRCGSFINSGYDGGKWSISNRISAGVNKTCGKFRSVERYHKYMYSVPYSDHSCFEEIQAFVKFVRPAKIRGIVSSSSCYVDPLYFFGSHCGGHQQSPKLQKKQNKEDGGERDVEFRTKYVFGSSRKRGRTENIKHSGVHVSRVTELRRLQCGAKIMEDSHD